MKNLREGAVKISFLFLSSSLVNANQGEKQAHVKEWGVKHELEVVTVIFNVVTR